MGKRIKWLECVRGGAILLVVLGHLSLIGGGGAYSKIIYLFHMPLYFAISGFLYGYKEIGKRFNSLEFIKKKLISLGLPYLLFSVIYIMFNTSLQKYVHTNTQVDIPDILSLCWKPVAHYWFIWVLVIYFIIVAFIGKSGRTLIALLLFGIVVALADGNKYNALDPTYRKALIYFVYFVGASLLGVQFKSVENIKISIRDKMLLFVVSLVFFWMFSSNIICIEYRPLQDMLVRIVGIVSFVALIVLLKTVVFMQKILSKIGYYSWYIYLLHSYFLCARRFFLAKIIPSGNSLIEIVLGMSGTVIGCMIIGKCCKKISWLDYIFYPYKLMK